MTALTILFRIALLFLPGMMSACVSNQHSPDSDLVIRSDDCEIVNGMYLVRQESVKNILANVVFGSEGAVQTLEIRKSASAVLFLGNLEDARVLKREILQRFSCRKSILTVVLDDQGSGGALASSATDTKLDLYSTDETSITFRFIDSALTFAFIIPIYQSEDYELILERTLGAGAN